MNKIIITDIKITKKGRYSIFTNGEYAISIDDETLYYSKIKIGDCVDIEKLREINKNSQYKKCLSKSYDILSYRPHSKKEIKDKLLKYFDDETVEITIEKLCEMSLLNDEEFCDMYIKSLMNKGKSSKRSIEYELKKKGIDEYIIEDKMCEIEFLDSETVKKLVIKKYRNKLNKENIHKVQNALMRYGFSWGDIKTGINSAIEELNEEYDI